MPINASLFAHIENDSSLSGTYALQGNRFTNTVGYLNEYLTLVASSESVPPEYTALLNHMNYLVHAEQRMEALWSSANRDAELRELATAIMHDITDLSASDRVLLPGGWHNSDGGHAIIYQFTRHPDGYHFTLFNAGDGLQYHAKKSAQEKELYNPTKTWHIPCPKTEEDEHELALFIERLFKARLPYAPKYQKKPIDNTVLYEEIIPSISYLNGWEIKTDDIPDHGYTGGQLSGTCAQRAVHQMLKINSRSAKDYQRFIFKFKHHALFDYAKACFASEQLFSAAVAEQIQLAIENNFKILNTPGLFSELERDPLYHQLTTLQTQLNSFSFSAKTKIQHKKADYSLSITGTALAPFAMIPNTQIMAETPPTPVPVNGSNLLHNLAAAISGIKRTHDQAARFLALQQLLLALPLDQLSPSTYGFYKELQSSADFNAFQQHLNDLQVLLLGVERSLLNKEQTPLMNTMLHCLMSLHIDVYSVTTQGKKLPSFNPFSSAIMSSMLNNQERSAFSATNHPQFDKKLLQLRERFRSSPLQYLDDYYQYYNKILDTEPQLKAELKSLYQQRFGTNVTELHYEVRNHKLEALFMIAQQYNGHAHLDARFLPLINKVKAHLAHEDNLRQLIHPFYVNQYGSQFNIGISHNSFRINSGLFPTFMPYEDLVQSLPNQKYPLKDSPAKRALAADSTNKTHYRGPLRVKTANAIQLRPTDELEQSVAPQQVTQADIIERDYFHLRSEPDLQIALTLDYFTRHIDRCGEESNQRYLEANIFQPGLLLKAMDDTEFLPQFDRLIQTGCRYFTNNGQHTNSSLFTVRLNYLVSRYLSLNNNPQGKARLEVVQHDLAKQLTLANSPEVTYVLNQYFFLTLMERINQGDNSEATFKQAYSAYVYLQGHTNPQILEDKAHRIDVECALAGFKTLIGSQPTPLIKTALTLALKQFDETKHEPLTIEGHSPLYTLTNHLSTKKYEFNVLTGTLYERGLAHHEVPLAIRHHPLVKHLGLSHINECLINGDHSYMVLTSDTHQTYLFHKEEQLTVQKEWTIAKLKQKYELQAFTNQHQAQHANRNITPIHADLPKILSDGSMDYWRNTNSAHRGIIVCNNRPVYSVRDGVIWVLDDEANETGYALTSAHPTVFNHFESSEFLITQQHATDTEVHLPRYNLIFSIRPEGIIYSETGELILETTSPIAPAAAGLVLGHHDQARYLVPIARFYATNENAETSDFYPVVHDIDGRIAQAYLEEHWRNHPPEQKPLWHYKNSEGYISYQLKEGHPIAENVADALYLVYLYLATNQPEKAWNTLEECNTRLGGLTGDPKELHYISWICKHLPHVLPSTHTEYERTKPIKNTPPYVACQLKAMSLLCDHLNQNGGYKIPSIDNPTTANEHYKQLQQQEIKQFLNELPSTVYYSFSRLQNMRRHLAYNYTLTVQERNHLLNYYHKSQPADAATKGALAAEWLSLNLETLLAERDALLAQRSADQPLAPADKARLALIEQHLKKLKPVLAKSSALELVEFNVALPLDSSIRNDVLKKNTIDQLEQWHHRLPGESIGQQLRETAINALSSDISDDEFVLNFPAYLQQALISASNSGVVGWFTSFIKEDNSSNDKLRQKLMNFCTKTLTAARHIPLAKQDANIPLLCAMLYRVLTNSSTVASWTKYRTYKFQQLVKDLATLSVPPLKVYQAKDVYQDILVTPEWLIAQQEQRPKRAPLILHNQPQVSLLQQTGVEAQLNQQKEQCLTLIAQYQECQRISEYQLCELEKDLNQSVHHTLAAEEQAGLIHFHFNQQKKALAISLIEIPGLKSAVDAAQTELNLKLKTAWTEVLALANEGPADPSTAKTWFIAQQAKSKGLLKKADLLALYSRADLSYYIEQTGLNREKAQRLHQLIHHALLYGIQNQALSKINDGLTNPERAVHALDLLSRAEIPGLNEPAIMLLQHEEQLVLNLRQVTALRSLLKKTAEGKGFNETIEKIIMGGGKSKVILPILAESKAQGDNLVVLEVPQALLATNHVDLNRTSQRLFGKRAYRFEFHRDSDSSPQRLEQMYHLFTEIMTTRSYLVTTGEAIQSLELKYIELLLSEYEHDETWRQQIYWCDKITNLFRHHADCVIDEVHQGLSIKKKLNYTSGEPKPLDAELIKQATALFSFISQDIIEQAPTFDEHYDWAAFKTDLATNLVNQSNSPLNHFMMQSVLRYGTGVKEELIAYLTNQAENMPEAVANATAQEQFALAFFKQQITVRLQQTLVQKLDKHYGASRRPNLSALEQTLAIPYAGSNMPNERNRFANELEAINKTIQMMLIKGISNELLIERIEEWQSLAHQELFQTASLNHMDETPTAQGFALLTKGLKLKLSQINTADGQQMTELHQRLRFNRSLIFDILRESALKQIHQDKAIISSDNFNHADQYRSVQGVSGTPPWNNTTYHHRLQYDKTSSLGTDGYIFELIRNKKPAITGVDYHHAAQFVTTLLERSQNPSQTRAIIDVKGAFTGVSNLAVAQQLAQYIKHSNSYNKPLKHVLYFNEQQILCAIAINRPHQPIVLTTSETSVINRLLDSTPEERFTYFDQIHTTGVDITQEGHTHALVLVDDKTALQEFLQGSMRLRQLEAGQTLELIVPQRMNHLSLAELHQQFKNNDITSIFRDAPSAAKGQMKNLIRRHFLSIIQDIPSEEADKKAMLMQHFRAFFEDTSSLDLFALYGRLHKKQAIKKILGHYQNQLKQLWQSALKQAQLNPYRHDIEAINKTLEHLMAQAIPFCLPEYEGSDDSFALEVEVQKEVQAEAEEEVLALKECYDAELKEEQTVPWPNCYAYDYRTFFSTTDVKERITIQLNDLCPPTASESPIFSDKLHASKNYAYTYKNQTHSLGVFLKPVFLIWYHLESDGLHATIITPQEAKQLEQQITTIPDSWIATSQDTVVAGDRPPILMHDNHYQSLREQVRFFNGEFNSLLNQESPLLWINEDPLQKFEFFTEHLAAYRPGSISGLRQLQIALTQGKTEGFTYISARPFEDLTHLNWLVAFPKTIPTQATEYQKLAEAFVYVNKNWQHKTISLDDLQQQFNLPINSLTYIDRHLNHLMTLQKIMRRVQHFNLKTPFLHDLSEAERLCIEQCLGISINLLYEHHNQAALGKNKEIAHAVVSINALNILRLYPGFTDNNDPFEAYFDACAQQANSKELLSALIQTPKLSLRLVERVFNNVLADEQLVSAFLTLRKDYEKAVLMMMAPKCRHEDQVNLLLKQTQSDDDIIIALLNNSKLILHFNSLITHVQGDDTLHLISQHPNLEGYSFNDILEHKALSSRVLINLLGERQFSGNELQQALNHPTAISNDVLTELLKQPAVDQNLLLKVLQHPALEPMSLPSIIKHSQFSLATAAHIIDQNLIGSTTLAPLVSVLLERLKQLKKAKQWKAVSEWEQCLNKLLDSIKTTDKVNDFMSVLPQNQALITASYGLKMIHCLGEQVIDYLSMKHMLNTVSVHDLGLLTQIKRPYSATQLYELAQRVEDETQIDTLLARREMDTKSGDILLNKMHYSGKMGAWDWLTGPQILVILNKATKYQNLKSALHHPNLSPSAKEQWLDQVILQQKDKKQRMSTLSPQKKLLIILDDLKVKACTHAVKALTDSHYEAAAHTAFELYQSLHKKISYYLMNPQAYPHFKLECDQEIQNAQVILGTHRGYKQILLDIVNALFAVVGWLKNGNWRLFKANTDSMNVVDDIRDNIDRSLSS